VCDVSENDDDVESDGKYVSVRRLVCRSWVGFDVPGK